MMDPIQVAILLNSRTTLKSHLKLTLLDTLMLIDNDKQTFLMTLSYDGMVDKIVWKDSLI